MPKYFLLSECIDSDSFNKFISFCNDNSEENKVIIIDSIGGGVGYTRAIINIINQNKDRFSVIGYYLYSSAFDMFYNVKCKKSLIYGGLGMVHLMSISDIKINENGKFVNDVDRLQVINMKETCDDLYIKKILNKKELERYEKGDEVYLTFKRMLKIFKGIEII